MNTKHKLIYHKFINIVHSIVIIGFMTIIMLFLGWFIGGEFGIIFTLNLVFISIFIIPKISAKTIMRLYKAKRLYEVEIPKIYEDLKVLANRAKVATPILYYIESSAIIAFSTGNRDDSAIVLSNGILKLLNYEELIAVLAHELAHIKHDDIWLMQITDIINIVSTFFSYMGIFLIILFIPIILIEGNIDLWFIVTTSILIFTPSINNLLQLSLSRTREYSADLESVTFTNNPKALATALQKIEYYEKNMLKRFFIPWKILTEPSILRTHPATKERVKRLFELSQSDEFEIDSEAFPIIITKKPKKRVSGLWW